MPLTGDIKGKIKTRKLKNTADAAKTVAEWLKGVSLDIENYCTLRLFVSVQQEPY